VDHWIKRKNEYNKKRIFDDRRNAGIHDGISNNIFGNNGWCAFNSKSIEADVSFP